ncbi:unnamed protein product, partial [Schistocephalus solidus]|uniref:RVT_thumb domain-containing protein n=1 Tax=Schistocephalus solidus TaxID=70667 RepID=A0A183TKC0_SCHSO
AVIVDDFSATPKNTSFSAVRFILGQPKKKDIQLMVRMHWEFEKSLAFKKALVVLFERFEVPSYGDLCPNVMVNLQKDTDPPESVLEIQGSCLSHDLAKEWFTEDANLVTLQIQGLSPASTSQADSLRLLLLAELLKLEGTKSPCPDVIPLELLKELAVELSESLCLLVRASFAAGRLPPDWETAWIFPIHKSGSRASANNCRPVSLTYICCKIMEPTIKRELIQFRERYPLLSCSTVWNDGPERST